MSGCFHRSSDILLRVQYSQSSCIDPLFTKPDILDKGFLWHVMKSHIFYFKKLMFHGKLKELVQDADREQNV